MDKIIVISLLIICIIVFMFFGTYSMQSFKEDWGDGLISLGVTFVALGASFIFLWICKEEEFWK